MLSKIHRPYNFVMFSNYCRIPMGSWGLPRVPRIPENSKGYKVLKFPRDPKLSKIFGSPRISKMSLDLQSSQGSKLLIFIMLSKIHRSLNFVMFSNYILRGTQEIYLLRGAPETQGRDLKTQFISSNFTWILCFLIIEKTYKSIARRVFVFHVHEFLIEHTEHHVMFHSNYAILPDPNNIQRNQQFYCWSDLKWFAKGTCIHTNSFKQ